MRSLILIAALALAACSEKPNSQASVPQQPVAVAPGQQPQVVVQQAPQQSGVGDMLIGGAIGYMLGSSGQRTQVVQQAPQVVEGHTTKIIERKVPAKVEPKPASVALAPAPAPVGKAPAPAPVAKAPTPNYAPQSSYNVRTNAPGYSAPPTPQTYSVPTRSYSPPPTRSR